MTLNTSCSCFKFKIKPIRFGALVRLRIYQSHLALVKPVGFFQLVSLRVVFSCVTLLPEYLVGCRSRDRTLLCQITVKIYQEMEE